MDWDLAIEKNRAALMRVLAMLVAMAGLGSGQSAIGSRQSGAEIDCRLPTADCRLPRHLHRAILRLLRPAESAVRRLVIVMARGADASPPRRAGDAGLHRFVTGTAAAQGAATAPRALPLLEPLRPFRPRRPAASGIPRISVPGVTAPRRHSAVRRRPTIRSMPPACAHRLGALGAALDDLPGQARRFARWRAREGGGAHAPQPGRCVRAGRPASARKGCAGHEVYDILERLQGLAFHAPGASRHVVRREILPCEAREVARRDARGRPLHHARMVPLPRFAGEEQLRWRCPESRNADCLEGPRPAAISGPTRGRRFPARHAA